MKTNIGNMIEFLTTITKEEADFIKEVLLWPEERKMGFLLAKQIFEEPRECTEEEYDKSRVGK